MIISAIRRGPDLAYLGKSVEILRGVAIDPYTPEISKQTVFAGGARHGDVENELRILSAEGFDAAAGDMRLGDLLERAALFSADHSVVIRGGDGLLAQVDGDQTDGMIVAYSAEND